MATRKNYFVKATVIDLKTEEAENVRIVNFSKPRGREFLNSLVFSCINNGKGLAIELDRAELETVQVGR